MKNSYEQLTELHRLALIVNFVKYAGKTRVNIDYAENGKYYMEISQSNADYLAGKEKSYGQDTIELYQYSYKELCVVLNDMIKIVSNERMKESQLEFEQYCEEMERQEKAGV